MMIKLSIVSFTAGILCCIVAQQLLYLLMHTSHIGYNSSRRPRLVLFGDSITDRFYHTGMLSFYYTRKMDVLNRGFSGYNSNGAKLIINDIIDLNPILLTISFGANDATIADDTIHHVGIDEYYSNLIYIIKSVQYSLPKVSIILITQPPVYEEKLMEENRRKMKPFPLDRSNDVAYAYSQKMIEVSKVMKLPIINLWDHLEGGNGSNRVNYLNDGLHLNDNGNKKVFELLKATIDHHLSPDMLPLHFPSHLDMNL